MTRIMSTEEIRDLRDEQRRETIAKFKADFENLTADYRHGLCPEKTYYKELCKLISRTSLHIDLNNL